MSPKELFQTKPELVDFHKRIVQSLQTHEALQSAFNQLVHTLPASENPGVSAANDMRRQGALAFIDIFLRLSEPKKESTRRRNDNLSDDSKTTTPGR